MTTIETINRKAEERLNDIGIIECGTSKTIDPGLQQALRKVGVHLQEWEEDVSAPYSWILSKEKLDDSLHGLVSHLVSLSKSNALTERQSRLAKLFGLTDPNTQATRTRRTTPTAMVPKNRIVYVYGINCNAALLSIPSKQEELISFFENMETATESPNKSPHRRDWYVRPEKLEDILTHLKSLGFAIECRSGENTKTAKLCSQFE